MQRRATQKATNVSEKRTVSGSVLRRRKQRRHPSTCRTGIIICCIVVGIAVTTSILLFTVARRDNNGFHAKNIKDRALDLVANNKMLQKLRGRPKRLQQTPSSFPLYPKIFNANISQELLEVCTNALWHTIETTTIVLPDGETFIHTGDIDDLWLRDSASQVHPLLVGENPLIAKDPKLDRIVSGLIKRVAMYIRHDPYANAFRIDDTYVFSDLQKALGRHDLISTWNYELDSACFYIRMLYFYWKQSPRGSSPDSVLLLESVQEAVEIMVDLWIAEQKHELDRYPKSPLFDCKNCNKPYRYKGLPRTGKGSVTNASAGLTWTGFRPSDDECTYGYLVPANMFAVVVLDYVEQMANGIWENAELAVKASRLALEIDQGIQEHGIVDTRQFGRIYAYEVDGLGRSLLMDDPNLPSLLSIPYLGYKYDDEIYSNTRKFIFSEENPTFRKGTNELTGDIEGYGSVHMAAAIQDNIWPMSLAVKGLTSDNEDEKVQLAETLVKASAGTGWMHESFDVNDPSRFTRSWFCWADSLFAELVMSITDECPLVTHKYTVHDWRDPVQLFGGDSAMI